jgi:hypothetical protein
MRYFFFFLSFFSLLPLSFASSEVILSFEEKSVNNDEIVLDIMIENPLKKEVVSVQSWVSFDPKILQVVALESNEKDFALTAPGENTFDNETGLIKIGRSTPTPLLAENIRVATLSFSRKSLEKTTVSFYNFQFGQSGNTSVRVFENGFPVNVLKNEPDSYQVLGEESVSHTVSVEKETIQLENTGELQEEFLLPSVQNLKITSGKGYVFLSWDEVKNAEGYYLYYSQNSGRYIQRKKLGKETEFYFDGLKTGEVYYFALTAYQQKNESDYSREVRIKVGYPDSSSSPLPLPNISQGENSSLTNTGGEFLGLAFVFTFFFTCILFFRKKFAIML